MRCLYCGKELALLKRLRGGGEFCSEAHKQSYQEEYNRLALSRLLQAQKKGQTSSAPAQPPAPVASIAVEEPAAEPETEQATAPQEIPADQELVEVAAVEETAAAEEATVEEPEAAEPEADEAEPQELADFLLEGPAFATVAEEIPYRESWLELSAGPALSEWQFTQQTVLDLASADLVQLALRPEASDLVTQVAAMDLSPQPWPESQPARTPPGTVKTNANTTANTKRFPSQGSIAIETALCKGNAAADLSLVEGVHFEVGMVVENSRLLELWCTSIDFPAEEAEVSLQAPAGTEDAAVESTETALELVQEAQEDPTPRTSLEALSRLHEELKEEFAVSEASEAPPAEALQPVPVEVMAKAEPEPLPEPEAFPEPSPELQPAALATLEITAEPVASSESAPKPRYATELFEIQVRMFPPSKPTLAAGEALSNQTEPLLPNLKSLPLRPKVALAPEYGRTPKAPAAAPVRTTAPPKPGPNAKPAARPVQSKPPAPAAKPAASKAASTPAKPGASKVETPKVELGKPDAVKPVVKTPAASPAPPQEIPVTAQALAEKPATPATAAKVAAGPVQDQPVKEAAATAPPAKEPVVKEPVSRVQPSRAQSNIEDVPSFEIAQPAAASWLGSLKLKLGIAIMLLLVCCIYFLGWGRKSHLPPVSSSGASSDGSGPSIIMGEGGWVEGWGGDPNGLHVGRQITIYRPSLKLSDYRLEFEANIDVRSVGWVFRAADPENYYAMKLMTVSNGLSPKVALFKYLVVNGRQTQVGRVPIDLAVRPDTVFNIREDIRGPQFTTFIQGQQVDSWTDDQLKTGGAGFLNEREERSKVKSVSIRYLSGTGK